MGRARSSWRGKGRLEGGGAQGEGMGEGVGAARVWGGEGCPPLLWPASYGPQRPTRLPPLGYKFPPWACWPKAQAQR